MQDFDMEVYLQKLLAACQQAFGADLLYMGLQGSWRPCVKRSGRF